MRVRETIALMTAPGALLLATFVAAQAAPGYTTLYSFTGQGGNGSGPLAGLALGHDGVLYGTTSAGGSATACPNGCGTVFKLTPPAIPGGAWTESILYSFTGLNGDGATPWAPLAIGAHGVLYGTTYSGGSAGVGTVFALEPPAAGGAAWTEKVLHSFAGGSGDGAAPQTGLAIGADGALYGATYSGGSANVGTAFEMLPPVSPGGSWTESVVYNFGDFAGNNPSTGLIIGTNGQFYGAAGGGLGWGTIFALQRPISPGGAWTATVIYAGSLEYGANPNGIDLDANGVLYGTTQAGGPGSCPGPGGCGAVFELAPPAAPDGAWTETVLSGEGWPPFGGVAFGNNGVLYGMAGGRPQFVYALTPPTAPGGVWTTTALHYFTTKNGGFVPEGGLVIGPAGTLYGVSSSGGLYPPECRYGCGTVFAVTP